MTKSLCLDCIIYTINNKNVKDNKYINIFKIWLSLAIKNSGLGENDLIHIKIDSDTYDYIKKDLAFCILMNNTNNITIKMLICNPPNNHIKGMMMKYIKFNYTQDVYMYCDIDILILNPLNKLYENILNNTICLSIDGQLSSSLYSGAFTEEELSIYNQTLPGFSAGKWIIYGNDLYAELLNKICSLQNNDTNEYYSVEQPFFNKAIYTMNTFNISILDSKKISVNGYNYNKDCILLDLFGIPGDGDFHWDKIINFYILIYSNLIDRLAS